MALDGKVAARSSEREWAIPEKQLRRGLYFLSVAGAPGGNARMLLLGR
jgi:hypothetical protein